MAARRQFDNIDFYGSVCAGLLEIALKWFSA
jgi:hypothetical protein